MSSRRAQTVVVAGSGRSGTTWIASALAACRRSVEVFEPLNPRRVVSVPDREILPEFPGVYLRPATPNARWESWFAELFSGCIQNRWTRQDWRREQAGLSTLLPAKLNVPLIRFRYQLQERIATTRVVKLIRANLLLGWLKEAYDIPIVFVIRHPCGVVASRLRHGWPGDLDGIHRQPNLVADYLGPHLDTVARARTPLEKIAVLWCAENLVPLQQAATSQLLVCDYESMVTSYEQRFGDLVAHMGMEMTSRCSHVLSRLHSNALPRRPASADQWQGGLTLTEADRVLAICREFGLAMYGNSNAPPDWSRVHEPSKSCRETVRVHPRRMDEEPCTQ